MYFSLNFKFQIAQSDRGLITIVNLATALDPTDCDIRFRKCELNPSDLNSMSVKNVNEAILSGSDRNMDKRSTALPVPLQTILQEYTFRESVSEIVTVNDLNTQYTHGARDEVYERLEAIIINFKK